MPIQMKYKSGLRKYRKSESPSHIQEYKQIPTPSLLVGLTLSLYNKLAIQGGFLKYESFRILGQAQNTLRTVHTLQILDLPDDNAKFWSSSFMLWT